MTLTCGFYNSVGGDRVYDAIQMSSIFDGLIQDGIFSSVGSKLMVTPGTGLNVIVGTGRAWFNHSWTNSDSPIVLPVASPHAAWTRKDIVVLEINSDNSVRNNTIKIVQGTPALSPSLPALTNTAYVHQYPLAYIEVNVGVTEISASKITNKVGLTETPFVLGVVNTISVEDLMAQINSQFDIWFDEMKDQLSTDAAGNLQLQIDELEDTVEDTVLDLSNRPIIEKRLGNPLSDNWCDPGVSAIIVNSTAFYIGAAAAASVVTVNYPGASFSNSPIIFATFYDPGDSTPSDYVTHVVFVTATQAKIRVRKVGGGYLPANSVLFFLAVGPVANL